MTSLLPSPRPPDTVAVDNAQEPSNPPMPLRAVGRNPFARPVPISSNSFTRTTLIPSLALSPVKAVQHTSTKRAQLQLHAAGGDATIVKVNDNIHATPSGKSTLTGVGSSTVRKEKRQGWRLLWRGGLEIGKEGFRLQGITFFALLDFPSTPQQFTPTASTSTTTNPFDVPLTNPALPSSDTTVMASPFPSLPSTDTDLCLSLESMRGRKYLQVRGIVQLPPEEVLEGEGDGEADRVGGIQLAISPYAPLLAGYLTSLLCRNPTLSPSGRTLSGILIGLGDEGIDSHHGSNSTLVVYGQRQLTPSSQDPSVVIPSLKLCVSRRRAAVPVAASRKVRPGEPLPRPPLFLPIKPNDRSRPFSRSTSVASSHGQLLGANAAAGLNRHTSMNGATSNLLNSERSSSTSGTGTDSLTSGGQKKGTPGRRGEKRKRLIREDEVDDIDERRRRNGKIVPSRPGQQSTIRSPSIGVTTGGISKSDSAVSKLKNDRDRERSASLQASRRNSVTSNAGSTHSGISHHKHDAHIKINSERAEDLDGEEEEEEDIFGRKRTGTESIRSTSEYRGSSRSVEPLSNSSDGISLDHYSDSQIREREVMPPPASVRKRVKVPQHVSDNRATIRKQVLNMLESRGYGKSHELFKDVFGLTVKGAYFVFRDQLESAPLSKTDIQKITATHLDMYLPPTSHSAHPQSSTIDFGEVNNTRNNNHPSDTTSSSSGPDQRSISDVVMEQDGGGESVVGGAELRWLLSHEGGSVLGDILEEDE